MEKTYINSLAYSKAFKLLIILIPAALVIIDAFMFALILNVLNYAMPDEKAKLSNLFFILVLSSISGFIIFYILYRSLHSYWIKIGESGITYNSLSKKIHATWDEVSDVSIVLRGSFGQRLINKSLRITTKKGRFYISPTFVDKSQPIPQLKFSMRSQWFVYPNGIKKELNINNSDIYTELKNYIPEKIK